MKCLSREVLEDLAIRFTTEGEAKESPGEGSPGVIPADLFAPEEAEIREHLNNCQFCRLSLLAEMHQRREYLKGVGALELDSNQEESLNNIAITIIRFGYAPYYSDSEQVALAASTGGYREKAIRFESEDRKMLLKQEFISADEKPTLHIEGQLPQFETGLNLSIDGIKYSVSPDGAIRLEDQSMPLKPESEVHLEIEH